MATELYQFRIGGIHNIQPFENVLYFVGENLAAGDVIVNAKDLTGAFETAIQGLYLNLLPASCQVMRYTAKRQDVAGGVEVVKQYAFGDLPGTLGGEATSDQLCPIVRLIPPMGTKSAGRFFLPAIDEGNIANNIPSATWITN